MRNSADISQNPFFVTAHKQGAVKSNEFSFKLASSGSSLYLGGANSSLHSGSIEFHNISTSTGLWHLTGGAVVVDSGIVSSNFDTVIDTGTTIMYGPSSAVEKFYEAVPGSKVYNSSEGSYSYPCNSPPTVGFTWGGKTWAVSSAKYYVHLSVLTRVLTSSFFSFNLGTIEGGNCIGALSGQDIGLGNNVWLLGDR